jgi:putative nucleotidyltransferase with HDIG domain
MYEDLNEKINEYIKNIPSLPVSYTKVLEICNNIHVSPADLNYVISLDPVLVGRVLKLINSAYYGLGRKVTQMARAIIMLGINTVKNLVLSIAVLGALPQNKDHKGLDMEGFWRHSLCVGVTAKLLAKKQGVDTKYIEEYFTAGLLHDIGKIPLNAVLSAGYLHTVTSADRSKTSLFSAENKTLGIDHCITGAMISGAWKLEGPVADAIVHHHNLDGYTGGSKEILNIVAIANYFAVLNDIGFSGDLHPEKPAGEIWDSSGIKENIFEDISKNVHDEIEKAQVFLKIGNL